MRLEKELMLSWMRSSSSSIEPELSMTQMMSTGARPSSATTFVDTQGAASGKSGMNASGSPGPGPASGSGTGSSSPELGPHAVANAAAIATVTATIQAILIKYALL